MRAVHAGGFGFDELRQLIEAQHIQSIEALIAALPEDLRGHYALVFSSRSLQGGSFAAPRVILFGSDAQLIVTFNGDAAERGNSTVETLEFDSYNRRFALRELSFPSGEASGTVTISTPNPVRCLACHDHPARPIWDVPPAWPGVYGEHYRAGLSAAETAGMREFLRTQPTHPRYRYLLYASRFANREQYVSDFRAAYNGASIEPPNAQLSALLARQNALSIASELAGQPAFAAHRYVLLAAAGEDCGALADFYPPSLHSEIAVELKRFAQSTAAADQHQREVKRRRLLSAGPLFERAGSPTEMTEVRFVAEKSLGLSTQHWTLALERGTYDFSTPGGAFSLGQALFESVARADDTVRNLGSYRTFDSADAYCGYLQRASRQALQTWYEARASSAPVPAGSLAATTLQAEAAPAVPRLLARCIECHGSDIAPALPFADPTKLASRLLNGHYPRGRLIDEILFRLSPEAGVQSMPVGTAVSAADRQELEDYFLTLAGQAAAH